MVESYRQKHDKKLPSATQKLAILLGATLAGFLVLGLVLRALGAGAVLFGAVLFALGLGVGWFARGRQKQPTVAVLPLRPLAEETENLEAVNLARAYANQVLELNKPSSEPETGTVAELESAFSQTLSPLQTLPDLAETPQEAPTAERKKWSSKNKLASPSSVPELLTPTKPELSKLEPVQLEQESLSAPSTESLDSETVPLEPVKLEPASLERKKWTPRSKAHDTLSKAELSTLEPVAVFETAASMLEVSSEPLPRERKKWIPIVKRDSSELEPAAPTKTVPEISAEQPPTQLETQKVIAPGPLVKLDSREILEAMGIRLPPRNTSTVLPTVEKLDSSEPEEVKVPPSSGRK